MVRFPLKYVLVGGHGQNPTQIRGQFLWTVVWFVLDTHLSHCNQRCNVSLPPMKGNLSTNLEEQTWERNYVPHIGYRLDREIKS